MYGTNRTTKRWNLRCVEPTDQAVGTLYFDLNVLKHLIICWIVGSL